MPFDRARFSDFLQGLKPDALYVSGVRSCFDSAYWHCYGEDPPVMSYFWPVPADPFWSFDPEATARQLADLPVCLVGLLDDEGQPTAYGLALTAGGQDLSECLIEAYLRLGFLPPLNLAIGYAPAQPHTAHEKALIEACRASLDAALSAIEWGKKRLNQLAAPKEAR